MVSRGSGARNAGLQAERDWAKHLREVGWPSAERSVATGWRTVARSSQDAGDIRGTPYAWSVKRLAGTLSDGQVRAFLDEAEQMRVERGTGFAFLVEKRGGHRPPEWRVWLELATLSALIGGSPWSSPRHPVAVRADHLLDLLLAWEARHAAVGA